MKTLELQDGDLVVTPSGHRTVSGGAKVEQELSAAFREVLGHDPFHADWGSLLPRYVGNAITPELELLVRSEVNRVLQNYIAVQNREVLYDNLSASRSRFSTSDVVRQVTSISSVVAQDSITVRVRLLTSSGETVTVQTNVSI